MRPVAAALLCLLALPAGPAAAGGDPDTAGEPAVTVIGRTWVHDCPQGPRFTVEVAPQWVRLFPPEGKAGEPVRLPRALSASGARFASGEYLYWSKGSEARIATPRGEWAGCTGAEVTDPWRSAELRGVQLRALGQEPGWIAEVRQDGRLVATLDYGTRTLAVPAERSERDGRTVWQGEEGALSVTLRYRDEDCRDAMSGEPFPGTVMLTVGDKTYRGCGRRTM